MLEVVLPRHLDSSLVDVDVHPTWVSLVIKAKVLQLKVCSFFLKNVRVYPGIPTHMRHPNNS